MRALDPTLPTGLLAHDLNEPKKAIDLATSHGHRAINPWDPFVDDAFMELARDAGLEVNVWTVNEPDRMRELIALGVDAIITDVPDVLAAILSMRRGRSRAGLPGADARRRLRVGTRRRRPA